jgi:hypothetical protein
MNPKPMPFPEDTAEIRDKRGFPHVGHLVPGHETDGTALYYFPGDFIAGDGFELWLDPITASDPELLQDYYTGEDE